MGDPVPLQRPRFTHYKVYDAQKALKLKVSIALQSQHDKLPLLTGPLHLSVTFFMKVSCSISNKKRESTYGKYHIYKPDLDNMIKWVADVCAGIVYEQDSIIASVEAKKIYGKEPRTEFTFENI